MAFGGKILGAGLGFLVGGPIGAVIGGVLGHFVGDAQAMPDKELDSIESGRQREEFYFVANLVGIIAAMLKADGEVRETEVRAVRSFFERIGYRGESMEIIGELLQQSVDRDLDVDALCREFKLHSDYSVRLLLMECLHDVAMADGQYHPAETALLERVGRLLEVEGNDWRRTSTVATSAARPSDYEILGVSPQATQDEIKAAYRELAKKFHPDKVAHLGDEFKELAHKKFIEIQSAYDRLTSK